MSVFSVKGIMVNVIPAEGNERQKQDITIYATESRLVIDLFRFTSFLHDGSDRASHVITHHTTYDMLG